MIKKFFLVKNIFIFFILFLFFLINIFIYLIKSDLSFTILSYPYNKNILTKFNNPLKKYDVVKGEFKAKENNLGIVAISFDPRFKTWDDILFRIKEKDSSYWYFEKKYWAKQFIDFEYFSFGFPIIKNSKGKTYQFELKSLVANKNEGAGIRERYPTILVKYKFDKNYLLLNKTNLIEFIFKKIFNNLLIFDFLFIFILSFFPIFYYFIYLIKIKKMFFLLKFISLFFLFIDFFFIRNIYPNIFFIIFIYLFLFLNIKEINFLMLINIFIIGLLMIFNFEYLKLKVSYWFVLLLLIFIIKEFFYRFDINIRIIKI